jgi:pimeloyl-ACP methyl ester carboxylesterase
VISDLELVTACNETYSEPATVIPPPSGAYTRITTASDGVTQIVAFRGSITPEDWIRDFIFLPIETTTHPQLGPCHAGFLDDAMSIVQDVLDAVAGKPFILTGHSLGGALALGVAGLCWAAGNMPVKVVTFGAPRFGMRQFVSFVTPLQIAQYRRGCDIVPEVPRNVPPLFAFLDTRLPLIEIGTPDPDILANHHIAGYLADVATFEGVPATTGTPS